MTRKVFTSGAVLMAAIAVAALLSIGPAGRGDVQRDSAGSSAAQRLVRAALQAHPSTRRNQRPPASARIRARLHIGRLTVDPPASQAPDDDVDNEENSNPTSTKQLLYHSGAVQTSPHVYLVFWGANWFSGGDPRGVANRLHYFYSGVSGSSWANVLKQYGSRYGSFTNPLGQYKGWIQDTTAIPAHPSQTDVARAVQRAAARIGDRTYNAQYVIAMPWGVVDQYSASGTRACAWHNYTYVNQTQWVTYTALPYTPYIDSLGYGCGTGRVNGSAGALDGVTINAGHEYAETVLDPSLSAWYDADGSENADKCSWKNLADRTFSNGKSFPVQPTWSNTYRTQYGNGCLYSS
jgi:serine protease